LCSGGGSFYRGLCICAVGLDILKFEQASLFYSDSYFNLWGAWSFVSEGLSPKPPLPRGDGAGWHNFSLLFNAIESEKYLGYAGITLIGGPAGWRAVFPNEKRELSAGCTEGRAGGLHKKAVRRAAEKGFFFLL